MARASAFWSCRLKTVTEAFSAYFRPLRCTLDCHSRLVPATDGIQVPPGLARWCVSPEVTPQNGSSASGEPRLGLLPALPLAHMTQLKYNKTCAMPPTRRNEPVPCCETRRVLEYLGDKLPLMANQNFAFALCASGSADSIKVPLHRLDETVIPTIVLSGLGDLVSYSPRCATVVYVEFRDKYCSHSLGYVFWFHSILFPHTL
jgi:hypothetical protein